MSKHKTKPTDDAGEVGQAHPPADAALTSEADPPAGGTPQRKFVVAVDGTYLPTTTVEAADEAAAVEAYKARHGFHSLPVQPTVTPAE